MRRNFTLLWFLGLLFSLILAYSAFRLYRWFNWNFGYESMVKSTIIDTVKPECLKK